MLRLSEAHHVTERERYWDEIVFFDIETTGFSRQYHQVGLITLAYKKDDQLQLIQYFATTSADEALVITAALRDLNQHLAYVNFNGNSFDIPFLNERAKHLGLASRLEPSRSIDLYRLRKKGRLKQTEDESGFMRQDELSGAEWAKEYKNYLKQPSDELRDKLLLHCRDDVLSLVRLLESSDEKQAHVKNKILHDPPQLISRLITSPGNLRAHLIDKLNRQTMFDLKLIDTPSFSVLDEPAFDQLSPEAKQALVLIEHDQLIMDRIRNFLQTNRVTG